MANNVWFDFVINLWQYELIVKLCNEEIITATHLSSMEINQMISTMFWNTKMCTLNSLYS